MYELEYDIDWEYYFEKVHLDIQKKFLKKLDKYREHPTFGFEHKKHGVPYFTDWIGKNYRVCFVSDEKNKVRTFYFIGKHKEYDKWLAKHLG